MSCPGYVARGIIFLKHPVLTLTECVGEQVDLRMVQHLTQFNDLRLILNAVYQMQMHSVPKLFSITVFHLAFPSFPLSVLLILKSPSLCEGMTTCNMTQQKHKLAKQLGWVFLRFHQFYKIYNK